MTNSLPAAVTEVMVEAGRNAILQSNVFVSHEHMRAALTAALSLAPPVAPTGTDDLAREETFQARVQPWMMACFGAEISGDKVERGDRLLEEVLELLQSGGYDPARVAALRDYVWSRPVGEPSQEVGGVKVTLAAYCLAFGLDMHAAGEAELARIWTKVEKIRAKQAAKPVGSALPVAPTPPSGQAVKALEWQVPLSSTTLFRADTDFGIYRVYTHHEANGRWFWSLDGYQKKHGEAASEATAKAAAQADYEARILSALLPSPAPEGMVLVPREPTQEMLRAAMNLKSPCTKYRDIYRAMLAASPQGERA